MCLFCGSQGFVLLWYVVARSGSIIFDSCLGFWDFDLLLHPPSHPPNLPAQHTPRHSHPTHACTSYTLLPIHFQHTPNPSNVVALEQRPLHELRQLVPPPRLCRHHVERLQLALDVLPGLCVFVFCGIWVVNGRIK